MAGLQYLDHQSDIASGFNNVGNAMARAALGMATLRQRQQQQEFENALKLAEYEREQRLDSVRAKLFGAQLKAYSANAEQDVEKTLQMRGLSKLADEVEASTVASELGDLLDVEGKPYSAARGSRFADTLGNRLRIANATRKAALEKAVILGVAPAATRLRPFNVGQYGTIDPVTEEVLAESQAPRRLHNVPPETMVLDEDTGELIETGLPRTRPPSLSLSPIDRMVLKAADARARGFPEEVENILSMTNLMSVPVTAPLGTGTTSEAVPSDPAQRVVGKVYKLPKGEFRWTANGWVKP